MSICSFVSELFWGKKEPVTPAAPAKKPPETFCRTNRYQEWLDAMSKDIKNTKADLVEIHCFDDPARYRGLIQGENNLEHNMHLFNCDTLEQVTLSDIYEKGISSGAYYSTSLIEWGSKYSHLELTSLERNSTEEKDPATFEVIPRFENKCTYRKRRGRHDYYPYRALPDSSDSWMYKGLRDTYARWELANRWNLEKYIVIGELSPTRLLLVSFEDRGQIKNRTFNMNVRYYVYDTEEKKIIGEAGQHVWVMLPLIDRYKKFRLFDVALGDYVELFDPIRVSKLAADEDQGQEAYVALLEGKLANTFTRQRYRVEVDSEMLYRDVIVDLTTLYAAVAERLKLEGCELDGRLFVDNIRYKRLDGSEHSPNTAGFATIGAEPYLPKWERTTRDRCQHTHVWYYSGPYIITNELYPVEPTY